MTSEQRRLFQARLRIGRAFGTGGAIWTPITQSCGTPATAPTLTVGATLTLYVLEAAMMRSTQALPPVGIYAADWWGVGAVGLTISAGTVLISADDTTLAYLVDGASDTSQGAPLFPLKKVAAPDLTMISSGAGYGSPLWFMGIAA